MIFWYGILIVCSSRPLSICARSFSFSLSRIIPGIVHFATRKLIEIRNFQCLVLSYLRVVFIQSSVWESDVQIPLKFPLVLSLLLIGEEECLKLDKATLFCGRLCVVCIRTHTVRTEIDLQRLNWIYASCCMLTYFKDFHSLHHWFIHLRLFKTVHTACWPLCSHRPTRCTSMAQYVLSIRRI